MQASACQISLPISRFFDAKREERTVSRMRSTASQSAKALVPAHSVLVIDDESEIRESLSVLLESRGYKVTSAGDGEEAFARINRRLPPQVIILDLIMPHMNGFEFLQKLRRDPILRESYVIVVSATDRPVGVSADAFFQKPYSVPQLLSKVQQLCVAHDEMEKLRGR
jgi:CheY-like chemotaxis protein